MENVLDLKVAGTQMLGKKELMKVDGGVIDLLILKLYLQRREINDFLEGFVDGFKENKT